MLAIHFHINHLSSEPIMNIIEKIKLFQNHVF